MADLSHLATVDADALWVYVRSPYRPELVEALRQMPDRRWDKEARVWTCPADAWHAREVLKLLPFARVGEGLRSLLAEEQRGVPDSAPQPAHIALELFPFQRVGVAWLDQRANALLCDDPGVGKTVQAIAWARRPCLVICPVAVRYYWETEIGRCRPTDTVQHLKGRTPTPPEKTDWTIITHQLLPNWEWHLKEARFASCIVDEAHLWRNAHNGARFAERGVRIAASIPRTLCLTGSPIVNRALDLWACLAACKKTREGKGGFWSFAKRFYEVTYEEVKVSRAQALKIGSFTRKVPKVGRPKGVTDLRRYVAPFYLRRTRAEVLADLPERAYRNLVLDLHRFAGYADATREVTEWLRRDNETANVPWNKRAISHLGRIQKLRHLSAMGKVEPFCSHLADEHAETNTKAVVFCSFLLPLKELHARFGRSVLLTGELSAEKKRQEVLRYAADPELLFAFCQTDAMGLGIDLSSAAHCYFMDLPWTPSGKDQAESRLFRRGQKSAVVVTHLLGKNTIDGIMLEVLQGKALTLSKFHGDDVGQLEVLRAVEEALLGAHTQP